LIASLMVVTLSFTKIARPPAFMALFASVRMWSQVSMARKNETEEAFTHTGIPSGNVREMKYCLRFRRSSRPSAVSPTSCGPQESPIMLVIEPLRPDDIPEDRGNVKTMLILPGSNTTVMPLTVFISERSRVSRSSNSSAVAWQSPAIEMQVNARNAPFTFIAVRP
jgi:hypothetical protein